MLTSFTVSFFGHRCIENSIYVEKEIEKLVRRWITEKSYVEFLIGRDGDFDLLVASCIVRIKKELFDSNTALIWVQPYQKSEYLKYQNEFEKYYDEVEIFSEQFNVHPKSAFKKRNFSMLDRSDFAVFWVKNDFGGAYESLKYAQTKGIPHINLYKEQVEEC